MPCDEVHDRGLIERYVAGRLEASEREALEEHFFECDSCFEAVELASTIRAGFDEQEKPPGRVGGWLRTRRGMFAAAAVITIAAGIGAYQALRPAPDARLVALGALEDMPAYLGTELRGDSEAGEAEARFEEGMRAYREQDYTTAAHHLRESIALDPSRTGRNLYLGASLLATGRPEDAIGPLRAAAALPSLAAESHYYVAKAYLRLGNSGAALGALQAARAATGPFVEEARHLEERVREVLGGR